MNTIHNNKPLMSPISRRNFILHTGTILTAGTAALSWPGARAEAASAPSPKKTVFGSNVFGWTQYYARDKKPFNLDEVIAALGDSGYDYLEYNLDAGKPENNAAFAAKLRAKGMRPVSLYTGGAFHDAAKAGETVKRLLAACKVCKEAGFEVISCNANPIGREKTDEELKTQVAALIDFGKGLNEMGLKLGIHHHMPEMANHAREFHYVFRNSPPDVVGFCYDVHWVWKGGLAPADALEEYGPRVVTWHIRQSRDKVWWEDLDTGDVDYEAISKYAREHNLARRFTVELALEGATKITRSAVENHRRSLEYVKKVFGA
ncbi:MAG: TIM barrel protein [Verrucomicrobia bacterium]|nr:TIM barrel protein [Verrucomicrobiota bacterium]